MTKKQKKTLKRIIISAVLYLAIILASKLVAIPWYLELVLFLVPYFIIGHDVLRKAVLGIVHGEVFDENFLMAVATVGALCLGEFSESVAVMLFYQIGELFQSYAVGKSRKSISDLMDIRPDSANLETADGTVSTVDPDDVPIGSVLVVRPGEKVPIDGEVISGESTLNTAALTGESKPRFVHPGSEIISGCVNGDGLLKLRTTKLYGESTVAKILDMVGHEARIGRISDDAVFYLMSRGIPEEEARAMIVSGFADNVSKELPLEYAMEMNNLIRLEMKGSIG